MAKRDSSATDEAVEKLRRVMAEQGTTPPDTSWTNDLPDDELPEGEDETQAEFITPRR